MRRVRLTWTIGGAGLVVCGVLGMLASSAPGAGYAVLAAAIDIVYAASVVLFAVGLSRESSVVARRPLGLVALFVVALWPFARQLLAAFDPGVWIWLGYVDLLVGVAAALLAAVQILRAGVVPHGWRWVPLAALAASVALVGGSQALAVALGPSLQAFAGAFVLLGTLAFLVGTLGVGVAALVLAGRLRSGDVDVFRSA